MAATRFGAILDQLIHQRCHTIVAFCAAIEAVGYRADKGDVSKMINGSVPIRRPPKEKAELDAWCQVLQLSPKEAKTFRIEAWLTHTPDELAEMLRGELARGVRQQRMISALREEMAAQEAQIATLERLIRPA